jgi:hypothetical protein
VLCLEPAPAARICPTRNAIREGAYPVPFTDTAHKAAEAGIVMSAGSDATRGRRHLRSRRIGNVRLQLLEPASPLWSEANDRRRRHFQASAVRGEPIRDTVEMNEQRSTGRRHITFRHRSGQNRCRCRGGGKLDSGQGRTSQHRRDGQLKKGSGRHFLGSLYRFPYLGTLRGRPCRLTALLPAGV